MQLRQSTRSSRVCPVTCLYKQFPGAETRGEVTCSSCHHPLTPHHPMSPAAPTMLAQPLPLCWLCTPSYLLSKPHTSCSLRSGPPSPFPVVIGQVGTGTGMLQPLWAGEEAPRELEGLS